MLGIFSRFGETIWNPYWLIVFTSSSDSNDYAPNEHEDTVYSRYIAVMYIAELSRGRKLDPIYWHHQRTAIPFHLTWVVIYHLIPDYDILANHLSNNFICSIYLTLHI